jgi:UDP-N-acetylglucosamine 2-epimerase
MSVSHKREDEVVRRGLELLEDAELQTQMRECQKRYGKPDAAGDIYEYIVSRGRDKNSL